MRANVDALLSGDPWVELVARRDLLDERPGPSLRARVASDPRVADLLAATDPWPPERRSTKAYDPKDAIWKVAVLADFGLDRTDPRIAALSDRLFAAAAPDGTFRHGGFDHTRTYDARGYTCISHSITGALARFGYRDDPRLQPAIDHIRSTQRLDGGWHPNALLQPGARRESEPSCPFGAIHVLRAAAAIGGDLLDTVGPRAANHLLDCWARRDEPFRPVGFGIGTTFAKLSACSSFRSLAWSPKSPADDHSHLGIASTRGRERDMATASPNITTKRAPMDSARMTALAVGVLFILTFVTSIAGALAYGPVLSDPNYITGAGADTRVFVGAFLELLLIITNIGCAVVLFPLLKRQNETLALGYVTARLVECAFIGIGLLSLLTIVTLRQGAAAADAGSLVVVGKALVALHNWTFLLGPGFADGVGTGMILGWLMYRSGLVSRRMALFGVIGGPLLAASGIAVLLGVIPQGSALQGLMTVPEIVWEAFLGLWLTFRGFRPAPILAPEGREQAIAPAHASA
jgi:hypothetical protein